MLYVDDREPRPNAKYPERQDMAELLQKQEVPAKLKHLEVGDYQFYDRDGGLILVSRKGSDLLSSVFEGHFQDELNKCCNLVKSYGDGRVFALFEGPWVAVDEGVAWCQELGELASVRGEGWGQFKMARHHSTQHSMVPGIELSLQLDGIMVMHTNSIYETSVALATLYKRSQEGWPSTMTKGRKLPPLLRTRDVRVARLMALVDRLPEKVALALLSEFGGIGEIVDLARKQEKLPPKAQKDSPLLAVPGFGPKMLENLLEAVS